MGSAYKLRESSRAGILFEQHKDIHTSFIYKSAVSR